MKNMIVAVACVEVEGQTLSVFAHDDGAIHVRSLTDDTKSGEWTNTHSGQVYAAACTVIDGRIQAVIGGSNGSVEVWDVAAGVLRATLISYAAPIQAVACIVIDGCPHAVTACYGDRVVQVWDLLRFRQVDSIALPEPVRALAAYGDDLVVGMGQEVVVLTRTPQPPGD